MSFRHLLRSGLVIVGSAACAGTQAESDPVEPVANTTSHSRFDSAVIERWNRNEGLTVWKVSGADRVAQVLDWVEDRCTRSDRYRDLARISDADMSLFQKGRRTHAYLVDFDRDRSAASVEKTRADLDRLLRNSGHPGSVRYEPAPGEQEPTIEWFVCRMAVFGEQ